MTTMIMPLRVVKLGNSLGVNIPKLTCEKLELKPGEILVVSLTKDIVKEENTDD